MTDPIEVPSGCLEIPGFIVSINFDNTAWLMLNGDITHTWYERGVWETAEAANEAMESFVSDCR